MDNISKTVAGVLSLAGALAFITPSGTPVATDKHQPASPKPAPKSADISDDLSDDDDDNEVFEDEDDVVVDDDEDSDDGSFSEPDLDSYGEPSVSLTGGDDNSPSESAIDDDDDNDADNGSGWAEETPESRPAGSANATWQGRPPPR